MVDIEEVLDEQENQSSHGGRSLEQPRKRRGRPVGSKNRAKAPVTVLDSQGAARPIALNLSGGYNIIHCLVEFCKRNQIGVSICTACGSVKNVKIQYCDRGILQTPISLAGTFELKQLCGSLMPLSCNFPDTILSATLEGPQGRVTGEIFGYNLWAAGPVVIVVTSLPTTLSPIALNIGIGDNLVHCLVEFGERNQVGITILRAAGSVNNLQIQYSERGIAQNPISFEGTFDFRTLCGPLMPPSWNLPSSTLSATLKGPHGQVIGGEIFGDSLCAAGPITILGICLAHPVHYDIDFTQNDNDTQVAVEGGFPPPFSAAIPFPPPTPGGFPLSFSAPIATPPPPSGGFPRSFSVPIPPPPPPPPFQTNLHPPPPRMNDMHFAPPPSQANVHPATTHENNEIPAAASARIPPPPPPSQAITSITWVRTQIVRYFF